MSVASVDLRPSFTIDSVKDNGSALELNISDNIGKRNGMVIVTAVGGSRSISVPIQSTEGVVSIDMNSIEGGIVNISCVVDGEVTDTINYNVKK